mgnify:CR=1 FL=1
MKSEVRRDFSTLSGIKPVSQKTTMWRAMMIRTLMFRTLVLLEW